MSTERRKPILVIVQRILPHYRRPFFDALAAENGEMDVRVYHGGQPSAPCGACHLRHYENIVWHILGYTFVFQPRLFADVMRERPEVVVLEGTFGVLTNFAILLGRRLSGSRTLYWTAGWNNPDVTGTRLRVKNLFIRLVLGLCEGAIVYGTSAKEYLSGLGLPEARITVAQNTIDVEQLIAERPALARKGRIIRTQLLPKARNIIVYVGQLTPIKRVGILLEAYRLLVAKWPKVGLLMVGDGNDRPRLQRMIDDWRLPNASITGEIVNGVEAYFAAGDLFVLPGTGGLALNQAMALGLPVIATIADGTEQDLIGDGQNGYIVPVDDAPRLAGAMEQLMRDPQRRQDMGQNSIRRVSEVASLQNMVARFSLAIRKAS